ncbi:hypothetical protein HMPREF0542_11048 [Ligilactobacillus ruminis ATCC 25644]|uniref:Uncharacterized protein n=1 Tax=Ligilactobacillus ruminis ATCC 25644 TaxID=525362 RepID=E7FQ71_9LACO|nr:hypothetical protein HMPREF0542_11048 [Ligilactobacillus ruminis ATCC 25644]
MFELNEKPNEGGRVATDKSARQAFSQICRQNLLSYFRHSRRLS